MVDNPLVYGMAALVTRNSTVTLSQVECQLSHYNKTVVIKSHIPKHSDIPMATLRVASKKKKEDGKLTFCSPLKHTYTIQKKKLLISLSLYISTDTFLQLITHIMI